MSQGPISLGKGNHFMCCLLNYEMEEDAAEVGESQMDIMLTFEEWKANNRVTWEESKTQFSISEGVLPPLHLSWPSCKGS